MGPNPGRIRGAVSTWAGGYTRQFSEKVLEAASAALLKMPKQAYPVDNEEPEDEQERDEFGNIIEEIQCDPAPKEESRTASGQAREKRVANKFQKKLQCR